MELFEYQKDDALWLSQRKRAAVFSDVGTGKTFISLAAAKLAKIEHLLVLCPKVMIPTWERELLSWGFNSSCKVVNYDRIIHEDFRLDPKTQLIIADESHALKSWEAQRTMKFYTKIAPKVEYVWFLSATPMVRSAEDLHPILSFCMPGKMGKFGDWREKHCHKKVISVMNRRKQRVSVTTYHGAKNTQELNELLKMIGIRRTKEEVLKFLPKMLYSNIPVTVKADVVAKCLDVSLDTILRGLEVGKIPAHISSLLQAIGLAKVPAATEFLLEQFEAETPVVVFFLHTAVGDALLDSLHKKRRVAMIYGSTSLQERQNYIDAFQAGDLDILLLNTHTAGVGITLTRSSHVVHAEQPWSAAVYHQANGRIDRIGQTATCLNCYNIVDERTTDRYVLNALQTKKDNLQEVMV